MRKVTHTHIYTRERQRDRQRQSQIKKESKDQEQEDFHTHCRPFLVSCAPVLPMGKGKANPITGPWARGDSPVWILGLLPVQSDLGMGDCSGRLEMWLSFVSQAASLIFFHLCLNNVGCSNVNHCQPTPTHLLLRGQGGRTRAKLEVLSYPWFKTLSIASHYLLNKVQFGDLRSI